MRLKACSVFLLLIGCTCLWRVHCSLPDFTPATALLQVGQVDVSVKSNVIGSQKNKGPTRLPGLCRRLKRRRVTILCNLEKFCWKGRVQKSGQVCQCPRGAKCSHFFIHSL